MPEIGVIAFWESLQDPAAINPCLDWEYWEPELVDKSKPGSNEILQQEYSLLHSRLLFYSFGRNRPVCWIFISSWWSKARSR